MKDMEDVLAFIYEAGQLKRVKRSGWWLAGIKEPESVAEHSFRTAIIGYVLSKLENVNTEKVMLMCLFQDFPETRINDLHKVGHRYIKFEDVEKKVFDEQMNRLPPEATKELRELFDHFNTDKSKEAVVARDADLLECAISAKEYMEIGYKETQDWINNIERLLKTQSAKELLELAKKTDSASWWEGLKRTER